MKVCRSCGVEKPLDEYHIHKQMKDGHLNKCKCCVRARVKKHRGNNLERIRAYDRKRGSRQPSEYLKELRKRKPNQYRAQTMVGNAVRDGRLFREPCEVCGDNRSQGHHKDYLKPLNVTWLCSVHHKQWHVENGEGLNP